MILTRTIYDERKECEDPYDPYKEDAESTLIFNLFVAKQKRKKRTSECM